MRNNFVYPCQSKLKYKAHSSSYSYRSHITSSGLQLSNVEYLLSPRHQMDSGSTPVSEAVFSPLKASPIGIGTEQLNKTAYFKN